MSSTVSSLLGALFRLPELQASTMSRFRFRTTDWLYRDRAL